LRKCNAIDDLLCHVATRPLDAPYYGVVRQAFLLSC
jgi:hypothetical protein